MKYWTKRLVFISYNKHLLIIDYSPRFCDDEEVPKFGRDFKGAIPSIIVIEIGT